MAESAGRPGTAIGVSFRSVEQRILGGVSVGYEWCVAARDGGALSGVGRTALMVAGMRAQESRRVDRLFDDQLAGAFVAAAGFDVDSQAAAWPPGTSDFLAIRTRFYDDQVAGANAAGIRQVVVLAAGLDGRAFRLDWAPGTRLFELDLPELFAFKERVLATSRAPARCERVVVAVDLRREWAASLTAAGFDPSAETGWLAEGLLPYLTAADSDRLLTTVTTLSAPGSRAALDHLDATAGDRPAMRVTAEAIRQLGAELISTLDDPVGWLARHGWQATTLRVPALGVGYGRRLPPDADPTASNATALVTAIRR